MNTTTSGASAAISSHDTVTDGVPRRHSTGVAPAASVEGRIRPLEGERAGPGEPGDGTTDALEALVELGDEPVGAVLGPGGGADGAQALDDVLERARVHRHDLGPAAEDVEGGVHLARGHGADGTEVLGQHDVGPQVA